VKCSLSEHLIFFFALLGSHINCFNSDIFCTIRVITKLPNTEQSSTNRQNQSTTGKLGKPQWSWLGTGISKEMVGWIRFYGAKPPASSYNNEYLPFNVDLLISLFPTKLLPLRMSYMKQELYKKSIKYARCSVILLLPILSHIVKSGKSFVVIEELTNLKEKIHYYLRNRYVVAANQFLTTTL
jgi:hypothetical protein